jgi:hypothetical protein
MSEHLARNAAAVADGVSVLDAFLNIRCTLPIDISNNDAISRWFIHSD